MPSIDVNELNIIITVLGAFIIPCGIIATKSTEVWYLGEALPAVICGIALGPVGVNFLNQDRWGSNPFGPRSFLTFDLCRVIIGIQLVIAGFQLPARYQRKRWREMIICLFPVVLIQWLFTTACIWLTIPNLTLFSRLVIGSCLAYTDPLLSQAIPRGPFAQKYLSRPLCEIISSEAGANAAFGFPWFFLAISQIQHAATETRGYTVENDHTGKLFPLLAKSQMGIFGSESRNSLEPRFLGGWLCVAFSISYGVFVGIGSCKLLEFSLKRGLIENKRYLLWPVAMGLFIVGTTGALGTHDVLACFVAGNALNWDGQYLKETTIRHDKVNFYIKTFLNFGGFLYIGTIIPWEVFQLSRTSGITMTRLFVLGVLVLIFRRILAIFMVYKFIPNVCSDWKEALFMGSFAPIGLGAVFHAEDIRLSFPQPSESECDRENNLTALVIPVVYWLLLFSILVHSLSIVALGPLYRFRRIPLVQENEIENDLQSTKEAISAFDILWSSTTKPELMSFLRLPPDLKQVLLTSALLPRFRLNPRLWPQLARQLHLHLQNPSPNEDIVPLRKQLKKEAKQERALSRKQKGREQEDPRLKKWELTVGIEIHAQLNTKCKLFSSAETSISDPPNTHIAFFDLALPGSQPRFQKATLLPAVRAALALNCEVQCVSRFDRKHYFYQDQPNGYQITQYYEPFARNGTITLYDHDGIDPADGKEVSIGIKQIQMEQDTAKTIQQPPSTHLLDFNRVSHPLIEIITLPHIHHPATAAAYVKKIQTVLRAVNVNTTGIEMGGLRADVNVSVRRRDGLGNNDATHEYSGIKALGQRVEIKNLVSFKAVEDAIVAERNRQINLLENGRVIDGETRGWNLGDTETRRLRGKEGEVDYRYMPDPDLAPVIIGKDLLTHLRTSLPVMPDEEVRQLVEDSSYGVNNKDAKTLVELDDGARLEYYKDVVEILQSRITNLVLLKKAGRMAANWVLMELGGLLSKSDTSWEENPIPTQAVADIVHELLFNRITGRTAKQLLPAVFEGDQRPISQIVEEENLIFSPLPLKEYEELVKEIMRENPDMVEQVRKPGGEKKVMWFVGQMMRRGEEGRVEANKARVILEGMLLKEG